jgi:hypothetical protein
MPDRSMCRKNSCPGVRPFDQARNVSQHKRAVQVELHAAQVWELRGERVGGDLGPRPRDAAQERALARVGLAQQAHVGDDLQLQHQFARFPFVTGRRLSRSAIGGRLEPQVSLAPPAAARRRHLVAGAQQVLQHVAFGGIQHHGAGRHLNRQVVAAAAVAARAAAALAACRPPVPTVRERRQAIDSLAGHQHHASAVAAIAAIRPAAGDVLLAPEADAAVAPPAGLDEYLDAIDEHGRFGDFRCPGEVPRSLGQVEARINKESVVAPGGEDRVEGRKLLALVGGEQVVQGQVIPFIVERLQFHEAPACVPACRLR